MVQLLRMLLSDTPGRPGGGYGGYGGGYGGRSRLGSRGYSSNSNRLYQGGMSGAAATSVIMGPSQLPVVLIPEPKRKWIIARASAEDMKLITEWIGKLDKGEPTGKEYETVPITYGDVREVATRINEALQQMPGTELQASVLVQALEQARQVMVFGRQDLREMVKKMIEEIDVPPGQFETRHFEIKHGDPDQIKRNIDELFGEGAMLNRSSSYRSYGSTGGRSGLSPDTVKTISHVALKQVTVTASPENMKRIAEQVEQWDVAVDVNTVRPRIIELRNSDPKQMSTLLKTLFSQEMNSRYSFMDYLFGSNSQDKQRIVGALYGQVTFEEVPGTKKIIVISNIPEAYDVVETLVKELDSREAAEVPKVVRLNYADPEGLAERLNAMFNEAGTTASISPGPARAEPVLDGRGLQHGQRQQQRPQRRQRQHRLQPDARRRIPALVDDGPGHRRPSADQQHDRPGAVHPGHAQQVRPGARAAGVHGQHRGDDHGARHSGQAAHAQGDHHAGGPPEHDVAGRAVQFRSHPVESAGQRKCSGRPEHAFGPGTERHADHRSEDGHRHRPTVRSCRTGSA